MGKVRAYEGAGITVRFDGARCIHAERCVRELPAVFDAQRRPWIDPNGADADAIAETIHRCPSGALTYERTDGGPSEPVPEGEPEIRAETDGPLYVRGAFRVVDPDGEPVETGPRAALCRCGASKNKPFCDNSHREIDFRSGA